jgi:signal transduction histidine kinase
MRLRLNLTWTFVIYLIFLSIFPLFLVSVIAYQNAYNALKEESQRSTKQLINAQQDYLDLQLRQLASLLTNVSGVDEIRDALTNVESASAFQRLSAQARVGYILNNYLNLTGLVSIDIFGIRGEHFHVGDTLDIDSTRPEILEMIRNETLRNGTATAWIGMLPNVNGNSTIPLVLTAARSAYQVGFTSDTASPYAGIIIALYNPDALYETYSKVNFGQGGYMVILDSANRYIYHPDRKRLGQAADATLISAIATPNVDTITLDGIPLSLNSVRSDLNNWRVASLVPLATFEAEASTTRNSLLLTLVAGLSLIIPVGFLYNRRVVRPLRQIAERFRTLPNLPAAQQKRLPVDAGREDEVGRLMGLFNEFLDTQDVREKAEATVLRRVEFEKLVAETSARLTSAHSNDLSETGYQTITAISRLIGADRAFISIFDQKEALALWRKPGIADTTEPLIPMILTDSEPGLQSGRPLWITDVSQHPSQAEKSILITHKTTSLVIIPMFSSGKYRGKMGFEAISRPLDIDQEGVALLGLVAQMISTTLDRLKAEDERESLIVQLRDSLRFKDQFLATMSHELRTPLNAIQGYTGLILVEDEISEDTRHMLTRINENGGRLLSLINDVLDISRINANRVELAMRPMNIRKVAQGWYEDFKTQATEKGIALNLEIDPQLPEMVISDEARLTQVVANLLQNALKFTERGEIRLGLFKEGKQWAIKVTDTGIGIPESFHALIFDEFRQVDGSSRRKYGGAGLGLSIVKKLVLLMEGTVSVTSEPNQGSTFTVTLPLPIPTTATQPVRMADLQR